MNKEKYPYEIRGNGYIHRPSHTYFQDEEFVKALFDEEFVNSLGIEVVKNEPSPKPSKTGKLRGVVRSVVNFFRGLKNKIMKT